MKKRPVFYKARFVDREIVIDEIDAIKNKMGMFASSNHIEAIRKLGAELEILAGEFEERLKEIKWMIAITKV